MSVLVVDVGTSSVRASVVRADGSVDHVRRRDVLPYSPSEGFVEFDPAVMAEAVLEVARATLGASGPVEGVGIANQRLSTVVWDRSTGQAMGPGIGWQDLRTVGLCLALREQGIRLAPNQSATKLAVLLDMVDPSRSAELCFGTVETWVAWTLSEGSLHVSDPTNSSLTGLFSADSAMPEEGVLEALRIPEGVLPGLVDSSGVVGRATALDGSPPIAGMVGDQQASLVGQACVERGRGKVTFGTGAMLDLCLGAERPASLERGAAGTYPVVGWRESGRTTWGLEAIMLSAGTCVEWLRDGLGVLGSAAESDQVAASCDSSAGVWFVPAFMGLGTPVWDYGARGTLLGLTRGSGRAEVVRAVLEGIAHRGADLLEAVQADSGLELSSLCADGGMTANKTFVQALADATGLAIRLSRVTEATTLGAGFLAGVAVGVWSDLAEATATVEPRSVVEPRRRLDRDRWLQARDRSLGTVPELSALDF